LGHRLTDELKLDDRTAHAPVSVICTVRDEARHVRAALLSALTADVFELVVVDDASTDETAAVLDSVSASDPRVRVLRSSVHGRGAALDLAFRSTTGEFVMNIDADDMVHPDWSRTATALMRADSKLVVVSAAPIYVGDGSDGDDITWTVHDTAPQSRDVTGRIAYYNPLTHSSALMRRSPVEAAGGYDSSRRTHVDYELWIRLAAHRWRLGAVDARMVAKRLHSGQKFERHRRLAYLWASGAMQARGIRAVNGGIGAWLSLGGRMFWGLLPRALRMGVRRLLARAHVRRRLDAARSRLERVHPTVRQI
jgi:cellulose synthase/poly-beta-1,6-N-acetylglucosamine synthase-like glycosyltransferase